MLKAEPGAVFAVKDDLIVFPEERLPGAGPPTEHVTRRVILVQALPLIRSASLKTVLIVPCSASSTVGASDVSIPDGESGFDAKNVVAFTSLVQPILKSDLGSFKAVVGDKTLGDIMEKLTTLMSLRPSHAFAMPPESPPPAAAP